jgi:hypothetical protein
MQHMFKDGDCMINALLSFLEFVQMKKPKKFFFFIHRYYHYLPMENGSALFVSCRMDEIERNNFLDLQFLIFCGL